MGDATRTTGGSIHVLHVDDESEFAEMAAIFLEREDDRFDVETAASAEEGLDRLASADVDCVVSDYDMPGRNGIEFLETVRKTYSDLPFILYTGKGSEEVASDAISAGVTEYLQKEGGTSQYAVLANRIRNSVEKYRAQRDLAESQQRLSLFVEQSPFGVIRWSGEFDIAGVNDAAEEILGYAEDELVGQSWHAIVPESDRETVDEVVSDLLENDDGYHSVNENVRKDGERIVCEWHNRVVTDEDDDVVAVFSQFQDVTERRTQERQFEAIFNNTHTFVGLLEPDGTLLEANETALSFGGLDREDVVGKPLWETDWVRSNDDAGETVREAVERARNGDLFRDEIRISGADREAVIDFSVRPITDERGDVTLLVPEGRDVTERKQYVRQLETLIDTLPGLVYRCRNERGWPMEEVRGEVEELTGYTPSEVESREGFYGQEIIHPEDREDVWTTVRDGLDAGETFELTYRIHTNDGTVRWVWERGQGVYTTDGDLAALEGFVADISERERTAQERRETNTVLRTILENLPAGVLVEDADRNVLMANEALCETLDVPIGPDDLVDRDCDAAAEDLKGLFADPDGFVIGIDETIARREPVRGEELTTADGRTLERDYVPYTLPDGEANLWIYRDAADSRH